MDKAASGALWARGVGDALGAVAHRLGFQDVSAMLLVNRAWRHLVMQAAPYAADAWAAMAAARSPSRAL